MDIDLSLLLTTEYLPLRCVTIISLIIEGYTPKEIGEMFNISSARVQQIRARAVRRLRRIVLTDLNTARSRSGI